MDQKYYAGIDLGGTSIKMGICTETGQSVRELERPTPQGHYKDVLEVFQEMIHQLVSEAQISLDTVKGVGVGVPALLDIEKGYIYEIVNLGWKNVSLKEELEVLLGLPCYVDNDANTAALGEMWQGAGVGARHLICITVGTGIGGGLILNGDIYHGAIGLAGEIGHVTVRADEGQRCNCGKMGCLETETSATAMTYYGRKIAEAGESPPLAEVLKNTGAITAKDVIDVARQGDQAAQKILDQVGYYLGLSLAQLSNVLNPEKIVIGGGVSKAGDFFMEPIRKNFKKYALSKVSETAEIVPAKLGNRAGWLGAAWLVHRNVSNGGSLS
ncbi:ROK family glucokinase [Ammoniphilus sp. CFH 90114]|uniref:ROK family glucokinase n=1 Tax=Ammoniphilus sp. CFH 90114 TaxID=2493665 RepID=UPI00100FBC59|nr:ROK family glucokinase [Ammoniphilus sp. CFH 90114]RXT05208.1 ROK family glucokinase [Ammoniphilus sp. CFH 90114]